MNDDIIKKASGIVAKNTGESGWCTLALIDNEGYPTASAISVAKADGIKTLYLCTGLNSNKTHRIVACNRASLCFNAGDYNITLVGTIEVLTDPAVKKEMWYNGLTHHFSGCEDANYCVLRFTTKRYNFLIDWQEVTGIL